MASERFTLESESTTSFVERLTAPYDEAVCPQPEKNYPLIFETFTRMYEEIVADLKRELNGKPSIDLNSFLENFVEIKYAARFENDSDGKKEFLQNMKIELQNRGWGNHNISEFLF